jgi:hemolysin III
MKMKVKREYTLKEEIASATSHGIGVGLGIAALAILTIFSVEQGDVWKIVSSAIFGSTIILMYLASTIYHSIHSPSLKRFFKTLDHASIYLLIAGSYTPFCLVTIRGGWGWTLFGIVWGLALVGVIFKVFFVYRFAIVSVLAYILMGWVVVIAIDPIYHKLPFGGLMWLLAGGLCYTIGTIFYAWKNMKYTHSIWHLFVLAGTICHFFAVLFYVIL